MATAESARPEWPQRPMRADARRNYERIVATAKKAFVEHGIDVPLDEVAKRAHVGAGTLYRHFPNRDTLIEAVYRDEVRKLADRAYALHDEQPAKEALFTWLREQVEWIRASSGFATMMKSAVEDTSLTFDFCKRELRAAVGVLLTAAQEAGAVRADVEPADVMRLSHGVGAATTYADEDGVERLVAVVFDGLRA